MLTAKGVKPEEYTCPEWYTYCLAAKWLGISPTEDIPIYWLDRALIAMSAEARAQRQLGQQ